MRNLLLSLTLAAGLPGALAQGPQSSYLMRYDKPAEYFEEAMVIGNGTIGAIVYGGTAKDRISLNDITLWTGEPEKGVTTPDAYEALADIRAALDREDYRAADSLHLKVQGHYSENYQPLGSLTITYRDTPQGKPAEYKRGLDLHSATAFTFAGFGRSNDDRRLTTYYASAPDSVMVIQVLSGRPFSAVIALDSQLPPHSRGLGRRHHFYRPCGLSVSAGLHLV